MADNARIEWTPGLNTRIAAFAILEFCGVANMAALPRRRH